MPNQIGQKAVTGTIYTLVADYFVYGLNFVRGIILARLLAPELFGILALADFFRNLFGQPKQIGFDEAVIQRQDRLEEAFNGHFLFNLATVGVSFVVASIAAPFLARFYDERVVWVTFALMGVLLLQGLGATQITYLRKNLAFRHLNIASAGASVVAFGVSVYLALQGYGIWALVSVVAVFEAVNLLIIWWLSPWRPGLKLNRDVNRDILKFGVTVWVGGFLGFVMLQFDDFLVGQFAGLATLGFYSKAYHLAQQPLGLFSQVVNKIAGPVIAEIRNQPEKLERGMNLVLGLTFKATIFVGMILFIWASEIIVLLIGEKWLPMVPMFRGLIFYLIARPIWEIMSTFFTYRGDPATYVKGQAAQAILLVTIGTAAVYQWGGVGAAVVVSGIVAIVTTFYLTRYIGTKMKLEWRHNFIIPAIAVFASGLTSQLVINKWLVSGWLFWPGIVLIPALIYLSLLLLLQGKRISLDMRFLLKVARRN